MTFYPRLAPPYSYPLASDRYQMVADFVERGVIMVSGYYSFAEFNDILHYQCFRVLKAAVPECLPPTAFLNCSCPRHQ
jgi:uncharacterized membrane protein